MKKFNFNKEYLIIIVLMLIYAIISFSNLGSLKAPKTYYKFDNLNDEAVIVLDESTNISKIRYYTAYDMGEFTINASDDGINYKTVTIMRTNSVFSWEETLLNTTTKYLKIVADNDRQVLGDIQIYDENDNKVSSVSTDKKYTSLIDELDTVPETIGYMNSTYFDEIYFARSAYEYVHNLSNYEWTHPPVGKLIISVPVLLFGFNPFVYRLMNNIAGLLMIPVMYFLAKKLFKDKKSAFLAAILMTFDNFHLAQSRMATVDSILVLFSLLSVLFMLNAFDKGISMKKQTKYLILSALFIGLAIATKWTGLYIGLGLAIVFLVCTYNQHKDSIKKLFKITKANLLIIINTLITIPISLYYFILIFDQIIAKRVIIIYFLVYFLLSIIYIIKTITKDKKLLNLFITCLVSFSTIPILIYVASYVLFPNVGNYDGTILGIINQIKVMYNYHAYLDATHPFSSDWYTWPIMYRPVWYYSGGIDDLRSTIVGIGNPAIWWFGIIATLALIHSFIKTRNNVDLFILIFILSTYVPYIFIGRIMFMYHFYIVLPFIMLAITSFFDKLNRKDKSNIWSISYIALVIAVFIIFYPVTTGKLISSSYVESLKWLSSWIF